MPATVHPLAALPETDLEIVAEVLRGASARFEVLMRRHNQRVFRTARAILRDDDEAQDAAQQAWLRAYTHLGQFDGRAQLSTWLTRIVVHESLRRLQRRGRAHLELIEGAADDPASARPSPEEDMARAQARTILEHAIDSLPENARVVLVLRDIEELSTAEVGEALGITEEAVRVRLLRARRAVRARLEETIDATSSDVFLFAGERCHRICAAVLAAIAALPRA